VPQTFAPPTFDLDGSLQTMEGQSFALADRSLIYKVPAGYAIRVRSFWVEINIASAAGPIPIELNFTDPTQTPYAILPATEAQPDSTTYEYTWSTEVGTAYANTGNGFFTTDKVLAMPMPLVTLVQSERILLTATFGAGITAFVDAFKMQYELMLAPASASQQGPLASVYLLPHAI
jgi:hypothetical protein